METTFAAPVRFSSMYKRLVRFEAFCEIIYESLAFCGSFLIFFVENCYLFNLLIEMIIA